MENYPHTGRRKFIKNLSLFTVSSVVLPVRCNHHFKENIRFGLTTDSHYADRSPSGTRFYRNALEKMTEFVDVMNEEKVDFVIHLGDLKDEGPAKKEAETRQFLKTIEAEYARFKGPRYHCVGNHDVDSINKDQFLSLIENTGIPKDKSYYSFDTQGCHFVVLDANYDKNGKDHFFKEGADWQDANIPDKQITWLKNDLEMNDRPTFLFCHHPLFEYFRDGAKFHVSNYQQIQRLIGGHPNILSVFQGHIHEEHFKKIDNINYITQPGMVDYLGLENNSFVLIEANNQEIRINGYKRSASKIIKIE